METLNLEQAANFLKLHPEELRCRAKSGRVPAAKVGKRWVFIESDLADYVRSLYAPPRQALRVTSGKENILCHSKNAVTRGTSTLSHPPASALDALLALPTKPKRRNCTTS
ncbi:helix-turn-helix domain-containing protein [Ferriphaselus amnicola]|uniref:helix-turn-helix domain-containing protein n=1 Tax=Ferriphaselus amnicola TaxID=1188319 RepID=UPI001E4308D1|nr:helix-turn-helix domain-containing protein [Ferriphaselus amnicola]